MVVHLHTSAPNMLGYLTSMTYDNPYIDLPLCAAAGVDLNGGWDGMEVRAFGFGRRSSIGTLGQDILILVSPPTRQ